MLFNQEVKCLKGELTKDFEGVSSSKEPKKNHLTLINEKKFFLEISNSNNSELSIIISDKLFEGLKDDEKYLELEKRCNDIFITSNFYKTLIALSKSFHDRAYSTIDTLVDGREDGSAKIDEGVRIGPNVFIGQNVEIKKGAKIGANCSIGAYSVIDENTELFSNVTLYPFSKIGKKVRLHSGVIIGADGFGYQFIDGVHQKIWHYGGVEIGNEVEIGAGSCVDGGTFSPTFIGEGSKLDNHVQVGHNCEIGKHVILCGQVGLGGSAKLDDYVVFGGKAGCGPSIELGIGCQVGGGGLVNNSWPAGTKLGGHPARPVKEWMKGLAYIRKMTLEKSKEKQ